MNASALIAKAVRVYDSCLTREQSLAADNFMRLVRRCQPAKTGRASMLPQADDLFRAMERAHKRCGGNHFERLEVRS